MPRRVRFYFRSGIEAGLPVGDRVRSPSRRAPLRLRVSHVCKPGDQAPDRRGAAQPQEIVQAWRKQLDIRLDPARVSVHLAALLHWSNGLGPQRVTEALWR